MESQWAEILVARRVEPVEREPLMLEAHHSRGDRDAALALETAKQQQFLGQRGLAGVRMRNDRKGTPAHNLL
jgi:hypothetical protein